MSEGHITPKSIAKAVESVLKEYDRPGPLVTDPVHVMYDPIEKRIRARIPVSTIDIARMVWQMYAEGKTHEQVTEWLDRNVAEFRSFLWEGEDERGARRWVAADVYP